MGFALFCMTLVPGAVLAFAAARREGARAGLLLPLAGVGYFAGALAAALWEAGDPRAWPVWSELVSPWRTPLELLSAAAGATVAVAFGTILLRRTRG